MKDLLPGTEHEFAVADRHGNLLTERGRLQVRVPVAVVPGLFMAVIPTGRHKFVEDGWQVFLQARFEFNRPDSNLIRT